MISKSKKTQTEIRMSITSKEGKEKKGTTTPLNQRPDEAATRGDQSYHARRLELRRG